VVIKEKDDFLAAQGLAVANCLIRDNIAEKFSEIDVKIIRDMEKNHYPKKKIYSSRKIKTSLRSLYFKKQLLAAFQVVAS